MRVNTWFFHRCRPHHLVQLKPSSMRVLLTLVFFVALLVSMTTNTAWFRLFRSGALPPIPRVTSADLEAMLEVLESDAIPPLVHVYGPDSLNSLLRLLSARELSRVFVLRWTAASVRRLVQLHFPHYQFMLEKVFLGTEMEPRFAALLSVGACGGIAVTGGAALGVSQTGAGGSAGLLPQVTSGRAVVAVNALGAPTGDLVAAQRDHPLVRLWLRDLYLNYAHNYPAGKSQVNRSSNDIIGPAYLARVLEKYKQTYLKKRWSQEPEDQKRSLAYLKVNYINLTSALGETLAASAAPVAGKSGDSVESIERVLQSRSLWPEEFVDLCQSN